MRYTRVTAKGYFADPCASCALDAVTMGNNALAFWFFLSTLIAPTSTIPWTAETSVRAASIAPISLPLTHITTHLQDIHGNTFNAAGVGWVTVFVTEMVSGMDRCPRRAPAIYLLCAALTILDRFAHRNHFRSASMDSPQRSVQPTHYHAPTFGDNSTPTPATRYGRPARHHSTLPPPLMEHPQSDLLQGIHGMLQGLVDRVSALEVTVANAALTSAPARGLPAQRGRVTNAKRQRILHSRNAGHSTRSQDDSCENIDPALETTTDVESDASSVCSNVNLEKREQAVLQGFVTSLLRRYCRVSGSDWPNPGDIHKNPITGQVYPIPRFQHRVDDEYNKALCVSVAHQAARELRDRECWPKGLKLRQDGSDPYWDFPHLFHCTKEAFRNLRYPIW
ncbi:hypothetical protein B0H13DRAFT_2423999 [Mycena leptocephala]|nr:hypothetical protein B0H13DRAFT_2423999 [Mycena leptocephala]